MGNVAELDTTRLVIAAIIGLALLLVLIIKFKVHAMLSILIGAIAIGLIAGMPFEEIVTAVDDGIGNTLKGIALLVGLGSMFGAILEASGGAQTLAVTNLGMRRLHGRLESPALLFLSRYSLMQDLSF